MSRRSRPTQRAHIVPVESSTEEVLASILGTNLDQMEEGDAAMALPLAETKDKDAAKRKQKKMPNFEEMCRELTETLSQPPRKNKGKGKKTKKTVKDETDRPPTPRPRFSEPFQTVQVSDHATEVGPKIETGLRDLSVTAPVPPEPRSLAPVQTSTLLSATPTTPTIVCCGLLLLFTLMFLLSEDTNDDDGSDKSDDSQITTLSVDDIAALVNCQKFLY